MTNSMDDLLREALAGRAAATPPTPCLDAETAAAFAADVLSAAERSCAEAHVADCARCQALLSALVRITPPVDIRAWWRPPAVAWLAPLAVAATALIIWVNVPGRPNIEPAVQTSRDATRAAQSDSSRTAPIAATEPQSTSTRQPAAAQSAAPPSSVPRQRRDNTIASGKRQASLPSESEVGRGLTSSTTVPTAAPQSALADNLITRPPAAAEASAAPGRPADTPLPSRSLPPSATAQPSVPSAMSGSGRTTPAEPRPLPSLTETVTVAGAEPTARTLAQSPTAARETVIVSPNPVSRWRIGTRGVVQHSADGGSTWQGQSTGVNVALTAGSSPSPSVCWLVGAAGVVLISTDEGRSWQRLAFPVAADLISVRATDDKAASVVTSDGRTFTTSDRGRSWTR